MQGYWRIRDARFSRPCYAGTLRRGTRISAPAFISKAFSVSIGYETACGTPIGLLRDAPGTAGRLAHTAQAAAQFRKS